MPIAASRKNLDGLYSCRNASMQTESLDLKMLLGADMSPITHLCASWIIGVKTTDNTRDCRLVALAGVAPDLDGLGLVVDLTARAFGHETFLWERFHHVLLHGAFGAALIAYEQHCHELQTRARPVLLDD